MSCQERESSACLVLYSRIYLVMLWAVMDRNGWNDENLTKRKSLFDCFCSPGSLGCSQLWRPLWPLGGGFGVHEFPLCWRNFGLCPQCSHEKIRGAGCQSFLFGKEETSLGFSGGLDWFCPYRDGNCGHRLAHSGNHSLADCGSSPGSHS